MPDHHKELSVTQAKLWTVPFVIFLLINFSIFMAFDILLPKLSLFFGTKSFNDAEIGRIFGIFTISAVSARMFATRLSYRFRAFSLMRVGLTVCAVATIAYYLIFNVGSALAIRFLQGAGFGLASTIISSLASQVIPPARMGEGMGYLGLGTTVALAIGPFLGVWLVDSSDSYFLMFAVAAAFYAIAALLINALPPLELPRPKDEQTKAPLVLISPKVGPAAILMFILGVILSSVIIFMPLYCNEMNMPYAGHFFLVATAGLFISRVSAGRIHDRLGHRYVIIPSSLLLLAAMLLLALGGIPFSFFSAAFIYGLSTGAIFPSFQALVIASVSFEDRTMAMASYYNAYEIGLGLGSLCIGYVPIKSGSYADVYLVSATAALLIFILYMILYRKK